MLVGMHWNGAGSVYGRGKKCLEKILLERKLAIGILCTRSTVTSLVGEVGRAVSATAAIVSRIAFRELWIAGRFSGFVKTRI